MTYLVLTPDVDIHLSPANSFAPGFAALYLGDVRVDLRDADQCDRLAGLLTTAAGSLRKTHRTLTDMGRLD